MGQHYRDNAEILGSRMFVLSIIPALVRNGSNSLTQVYRCTRPEASPSASFCTSATVTQLKSPSTLCFNAEAATANSIIS